MMLIVAARITMMTMLMSAERKVRMSLTIWKKDQLRWMMQRMERASSVKVHRRALKGQVAVLVAPRTRQTTGQTMKTKTRIGEE